MAIALAGRDARADLPEFGTINARKYWRGAGLLAAATLQPPGVLHGATKVLIFFHGYNNSRFQAQDSYDGFRQKLPRLTQSQIGYFWPSDAMRRLAIETSAPGLFDTLISLASYTNQVDSALASARLLSTVLTRELNHRRARMRRGVGSNNLEVCIVAHSLGCRVALELLRNFVDDAPELLFPLVVLMAPAVPKKLVRPGEDLREALGTPTNVLVYSSTNDEALGLAFRIGQHPHKRLMDLFQAGEGGALGLSGIEATHNLHRRHDEKRKHGHYWTATDIPQEVERCILSGFVPRDPARRLTITELYASLQ